MGQEASLRKAEPMSGEMPLREAEDRRLEEACKRVVELIHEHFEEQGLSEKEIEKRFRRGRRYLQTIGPNKN